MKVIVFLMACFCFYNAASQIVVIDKKHLQAVIENGFAREGAEFSYRSSLDQIKKNTDDIILNVGSLALVQKMIFNSLTQVNEALKDAIQVKQSYRLFQSINQNSKDVLDQASEDPILLLFAEEYCRYAKERSLNLVTEVSTFVLSEKENILINYNVRDELLSKILTELQIIDAYLLAIKRTMYWVKINGVLRSLNPYQNYINRDMALINDIILKRKILEK